MLREQLSYLRFLGWRPSANQRVPWWRFIWHDGQTPVADVAFADLSSHEVAARQDDPPRWLRDHSVADFPNFFLGQLFSADDRDFLLLGRWQERSEMKPVPCHVEMIFVRDVARKPLGFGYRLRIGRLLDVRLRCELGRDAREETEESVELLQ